MAWLAFAVAVVVGAVCIGLLLDHCRMLARNVAELRERTSDVEQVMLYVTDWCPGIDSEQALRDDLAGGLAVQRWRGQLNGTSTSHRRAPRSSGARAG